jgi:hypothetical protein
LSVTVRVKHTLRVIDNSVIRQVFRPNRQEVTEGWVNYVVRSFITWTLHQVSLDLSNRGIYDGQQMLQAWERRERRARLFGNTLIIPVGVLIQSSFWTK